jgi:pimeloyl-[acyl-carrier protein] methyl ester esterase
MSGRLPGIHVESFGQGPELVMVHGWAMHGGVWRDFAERLANRVRVTLVDLPGHGRSGDVEEFSLNRVAAVLADAVPQPAHWLGWSLGALLALAVAERRAGRVRSVTLLAGSPRFVAAPGWPGVTAENFDQFARDFETDFRGTAKRFLALQTFGMADARTSARRVEARLAECAPPESRALRGGLALLQGEDLRESLRRLDCPALAVLGARDRLVPEATGTALRGLAPRAEVHVLEAAAHLPFLTHPDETEALIVDFIRRHHRADRA